jgi:parallel beta-helix repeat protein
VPFQKSVFSPGFAICILSWAVGPTQAARINCTQSALLAEVSAANAAGGGTITFNCSNTTIPMTTGVGALHNNVIIDGESRNITLEYVASLTGCSPNDGGGTGGGHEIGEFSGGGNTLRNLTFRNFMESWQIEGPNNTVEGNTFIAHICSDDGLSMTQTTAQNYVVRNNTFRGYTDKAIQASYGSGLIAGNTFTDCTQPIRSPYDNSAGGLMTIRGNTFNTSGDLSSCSGIHMDGTYQVIFENNTHSCLRGVRFGGAVQAIVRNNVITGNSRGGLRFSGASRGSVYGNTITHNGNDPGTELPGGVIVEETAQADLGGGSLMIHGQTVSSPGNNILRGNGFADLRNMNSAFSVRAEQNCWDHTSASDITSLDTAGPVDANPSATTCSSPPPPPGSTCDLNNDSSQNVLDIQLCIIQALGAAACSTGDINNDTICNILDVQRVIGAVLGGVCSTQ